MGRQGRAVMVALALAGLVGWAAAAVALDTVGQRRPPTGPWDAIVVAGCRVDPDGRPSLALQRRTAHAVALWELGLAPVVVFTGGVGANPPSEARAAADHAAALGLPPGAALLEDRSTSTEENAAFTATLMRDEGLGDRVLVVTDSYHAFRAGRVFSRHFSEAFAVGSTPGPWVRARGSLREVAAVAVYKLRGRI